MPSDLSSYLASRYLVADPKPSSKKRKRKQAAADQGLLITDDADSAWGTNTASNDDNGEDGPVMVSGSASSEFRKAKKSNWKNLSGKNNSEAQNDDNATAADAILASAAAESTAAGGSAADDGPVVEDDTGVVKMSDGTHAGLQSAASVAAQLARREREERADFERHRKSAKEEETVYRDATGRRIDVSMRRAEARKAAAEAEEKERLKKEELKGEVQQQEARKRREQLDDAKLMTVARGIDDVDMNRELKEKERWNDPMMQFLEKKDAGGGAGSKGRAKKGKPVYAGAAPPNRYGIKPGYRWDGVDRGNGFEADRFRAINRREMHKDLSYSWQMDE